MNGVATVTAEKGSNFFVRGEPACPAAPPSTGSFRATSPWADAATARRRMAAAAGRIGALGEGGVGGVGFRPPNPESGSLAPAPPAARRPNGDHKFDTPSRVAAARSAAPAAVPIGGRARGMRRAPGAPRPMRCASVWHTNTMHAPAGGRARAAGGKRRSERGQARAGANCRPLPPGRGRAPPPAPPPWVASPSHWRPWRCWAEVREGGRLARRAARERGGVRGARIPSRTTMDAFISNAPHRVRRRVQPPPERPPRASWPTRAPLPLSSVRLHHRQGRLVCR